MGLFNKLFKANSEGLIEAYLESYRNLKSATQIQIAAQGFEAEFYLSKEFHYAYTTIGARKYDEQSLEDVLFKFAQLVMINVKEKNSLSERQMIKAMLMSAHLMETGGYPRRDFSKISDNYISKYFDEDELNSEMDLLNIQEIFGEIPMDFDMESLRVPK